MKQEVLNFITPLTADFEGFSASVYKCPAGFDTIGYGRNIEANPLSPEEKAKLMNGKVSKAVAQEWLEAELSRCYDSCDKTFLWFKHLDTKRAGAIVDMAYNMGLGTLKTFKNSLALMEAKDYGKAAENFRKSRWFSQVKRRGVRITEIIESGA
ncbi:glycoside hydrolase family protein [Helicobacter sp.]|uniref:glycoside hydrolase family protein n=1 Tax=Helicobacter sp. TaxID=218 RepID=UPI002A74B286|nr:glycoside hydrolase family protein [Helicobacter sp.]MDY2585458.1 glycoside hydrolase family protein [Helicobacter sp.]